MENELDPEILAFWNLVKYHLCVNGLLDVAEKYPQLMPEVNNIRAFRPHVINMATCIGDKMVGSQVNYTGSEWEHLVEGRKVTVAETPLVGAAHGGDIYFTIDGHILACPQDHLSFD